MKKKIVIVGASYIFVPRIVKDFCLTRRFEDYELVLLEIIPEHLDLVYRYCLKVKETLKSEMKITATQNRKKALEEAQFVVVSIMVGGFEAWQVDLKTCLKYGISHGIGDTIGPAALSRCLRVVPECVEIVKDMEKYCPRAWCINLTNPMAQITKALNQYTKIKTIGLCHEITGEQVRVSRIFKVKNPLQDIRISAAGVNHLIFATSVKVRNREVLHLLPKYKDRDVNGHVEDALMMDESHWLDIELYERLGAMPIASDRHTAEFFPYFHKRATRFGREYGFKPLSIRWRRFRRRGIRKIMVDAIQGKTTIPNPSKFSGEDVHSIMLAILENKKEIHQVNMINRGTIPGLPDNACVEVPAVVDRRGLHPIRVALPDHIISILHPLASICNLTVEAAIKGDMDKIIQAFHLDPLITDYKIIPKLARELVQGNKKWLKRFGGGSALRRRKPY
jgi:alpha-galactosidase